MARVRRFVLAPLLAVTATLLVALALVSFGEAVEGDPTAALYGAGLLGVAALAAAVAVSLFTGSLPAGRGWAPRLASAAVALPAAVGALAAGFLSLWSLTLAAGEEDGFESSLQYTARERAEWFGLGVFLAVGAVGLFVLSCLLAWFALSGKEQRPRAATQAVAAGGVLVAASFFAALVLNAVVGGDYP